MSLRGKIAIVGAAESDIGRPGLPEVRSPMQLATQAAYRAMDDAGVQKKDIDALFTCGMDRLPVLDLGEYMGLFNLRFFDSTAVGGSSWVIYLEHAAAAIEAGLCEVALIAHGEAGAAFSRRARPVGSGLAFSPMGQFESPYGNLLITNYAMIARRHMHQYGTTSEQLAEIAVSTRKWAMMNPNAAMRDPLTIEDVLESRMLADPLHLLDCCLVSDAGGAVIVTSAERARDFKKQPVYVLGTGENNQHSMISQMPSDMTRMSSEYSGRRAFEMAGVQHSDIDLAMIYDSFTITVLVALEDLGFCKKGEGGEFVSNQRTAPGGDFPMNTNGGGLSYAHPGMYGMFTLLESVTQLRGEAGERQLPKCDVALAHGTGGYMSSGGTAILSTSV